MARYALVRIGRSIVLIVSLVVLVFVVTSVVGDPVARSLPLTATPEQFEQRRAELGLDRPLSEQFGEYIGDAARFDFGDSYSLGVPAGDVVLERLPRSLLLVVAGMGLAAVVGVPLGIAMAVSKRGWVDRSGNFVSLVALSLPQFWVGILLVLVFAIWLDVLPPAGIGSWTNLVLPAVTLATAAAGRTAQITQATLRDELQNPYIRTARAKGMPPRRIMLHALRNAAVPIVTIFGYETVTAFAGYTLLVEAVFAWPGLGPLLLQAVTRLDLPLTTACAITIALLVVVANTAIDIVYRKLDPRIAVESSQ